MFFGELDFNMLGRTSVSRFWQMVRMSRFVGRELLCDSRELLCLLWCLAEFDQKWNGLQKQEEPTMA
ncbi:Uncharacterized protein TCM_040478 [Theobroma cacao]|uniref:Uncharacterized protein n=1 Tax=Theobroma cacao TaxID=3641 RepID=A0A061GRM7_THECC|nr:Uncharacterized protein TCM_040478 [Theobroma cacao]